ncbi:MAG TPA: SRPBCC domain-containing protein [Streptosporangiaceae bacterium]|nr:SRPBCC domain-containing protein [Streptosporangiaceae bacterium]
MTTDIDAPPLEVWAVLTDLASYPQWNPLFPEASGELAVGSSVTLKTVQPRGRTMTVKAIVLAVAPGAELRWTAGLKGIIGGEHAFVLGRQGSGTRLNQSESFGGLLAPLSGRVLARAEASFRELNEAIKARSERH